MFGRLLKWTGWITVTLAMVACGEPPVNGATDSGSDGGGTTCTSDLRCSDGLFCNGMERCMPGAAGASAIGCLPGTTACLAGQGCDEAMDRCTSNCPDADGDGVSSSACGGGDCDDADPMRHPGAVEMCDPPANVDEDCDPTTFGLRDGDGDGVVSTLCCNGTNCGTDCNDALPSVHPSAVEACNGVDDDCDTSIDESVTGTYYADCDGDSIGAGAAMTGCTGALCMGHPAVATSGDCDDTNASVNPAAPEVCNGVDDNCVLGIDEGLLMTFYADCDLDSYGDPAVTTSACSVPALGPASCTTARWVSRAGDCDGTRDTVSPVGVEICNGRDDDCDGTIDGSSADAWCGDAARLAPLHAASAACVAGACAATSCAGTFRDCVLAGDCAIDISTDAAHCGACGRTCPWNGCGASVCDPAQVATGLEHTCARRASGAVLCWGQASNGQLGDGVASMGVSFSPVGVLGLSDAIDIGCGFAHSCAARASGGVVCWGANTNGQIGDGSTTDRGVATPVSGLTATVVELAVGNAHTCARYASGTVACWGSNSNGQLGDGTTADRHTPVVVGGLTDAVEIVSSYFHTCARRSSGAVACWGLNSGGQLGDGTTNDSSAPVAVMGLTDAIELAAGFLHTCARRATGEVVCWGSNAQGQLGDGTTTTRPSPTAVVGLGDAVEIAPLYDGTCARRTSGAVVCWGQNDFGQLGDGTNVDRSMPTPVLGLLDATHLGGGHLHACAVRATGDVACWGGGWAGQLGDHALTGSSTPVTVVPP